MKKSNADSSVVLAPSRFQLPHNAQVAAAGHRSGTRRPGWCRCGGTIGRHQPAAFADYVAARNLTGYIYSSDSRSRRRVPSAVTVYAWCRQYRTPRYYTVSDNIPFCRSDHATDRQWSRIDAFTGFARRSPQSRRTALQARQARAIGSRTPCRP